MESRQSVDIWDRVTDTRTLLEAFEKVRTNNGGPGGDGITVSAFHNNLTLNLARLSTEMREGLYRPSSYRRVNIPKRNGQLRKLTIPAVSDRVVHGAIALVLEPILEPKFENCSFAYRKGRSVNQAVARIEMLRDRGYRHVVEADINDYFNSINHGLLSHKLKSLIQAAPGSQAIQDFIAESLVDQAEVLGTPGRGLVQGSPLSPLLANLYLDALDEEIEKQGVQLVRFADDFVVLCKSAARAEEAMEHVRQVLGQHHLTLHEKKTGLVTFDSGFEFLGHMFVRSLALKKKPQRAVDALEEKAPEEPPVVEPEIGELVSPSEGARYSRGGSTAHVYEEGRRIVLRNESFSITNALGDEIVAMASRRVDRLDIGPDVSADWNIVRQCLDTGTDLALVNGWGETLGWLVGSGSSLADRHLKQAQAVLDEDFRFAIARLIVDARIRNQRTQLFRLNRQKELESVRDALVAMARNLRKLPHAANIDQLRGLEGASGAHYWPALAALCDGVDGDFRRAKPATDPLNATVNYLCALLERDIRAAIQKAGLHAGFGFLHSTRDRSDAFVYDVMEPFRAPLTEGLAVFLFNSRRLRRDMFDEGENSVRIGSDARRVIITGYEQFAAKRVNVTGRNGKLAWKLLMLQQARSLEQAFSGSSLEKFQPYLMEV